MITHLAREGNEEKVYRRVREEISLGRQAYFVYPLIEESEALDVKDAESAFRALRDTTYKGIPMALIHSRVPEDDKEAAMARFASGEAKILVATSVVEVGVDVANASCMVIEHAERFGLSTLHQLRGRVGRGADQSYAFLVYGTKLTPEGVERLKIMMETTDGFAIAERDMRLRGPGELLGVRQSGFLNFRVADLAAPRPAALPGPGRREASPCRGPRVPASRKRRRGEDPGSGERLHGGGGRRRRGCGGGRLRCGLPGACTGGARSSARPARSVPPWTGCGSPFFRSSGTSRELRSWTCSAAPGSSVSRRLHGEPRPSCSWKRTRGRRG